MDPTRQEACFILFVYFLNNILFHYFLDKITTTSFAISKIRHNINSIKNYKKNKIVLNKKNKIVLNKKNKNLIKNI